MANTFAPFGFQQYSGTGSSPTYEQVTRLGQYNAAALYAGDPLYPLADGTVAKGTPGTDQIAGVFVGCKYLSVSQKRVVWNNYWPGTDVASGQYVEIYLVNDPNAQFVVQSDGTGLTLADVGANVQFAYGTGNTLNGQSGAYVLTPGTANTLPFKVVSIVTTPVMGASNPTPGAYAYAVVAFNNISTKQLLGV